MSSILKARSHVATAQGQINCYKLKANMLRSANSAPHAQIDADNAVFAMGFKIKPLEDVM